MPLNKETTPNHQSPRDFMHLLLEDRFWFVHIQFSLPFRGAHDVMAIIEGNGHNDTSSNPGRSL